MKYYEIFRLDCLNWIIYELNFVLFFFFLKHLKVSKQKSVAAVKKNSKVLPTILKLTDQVYWEYNF